MENILDILNTINNRDTWFGAIAFISAIGTIYILDHNKYGFNFSEKFIESYFFISASVIILLLLSSQSSTYLYEEYTLFQNDDISYLEFLAFLLGMFGGLIAFNLVLTYISIPLFIGLRKLSNYINKL